MATGEKFSKQKYQSDAGGVYSIRISADALAANAGGVPTAGYTDKRVKVSVSEHGNKRKSGLHSRGLVAALPAVSPATGYTSHTFIPILEPFVTGELSEGSFITYQGGQWEIISQVAET